jgi:hypothetical protein
MASRQDGRSRPSFGERVYRRLLRLYPREFADEYGNEMAALYRDRAREEATLSLWLELLVDIARTAPMEQLTMLRATQASRSSCDSAPVRNTSRCSFMPFTIAQRESASSRPDRSAYSRRVGTVDGLAAGFSRRHV